MQTKTDGQHDDLLTKRQWALKGCLPNEDAVGEELWTNERHIVTSTYYSPKDVHPASEEELAAYWAPVRECRNRARKNNREKKRKEVEELRAKLAKAYAYIDEIRKKSREELDRICEYSSKLERMMWNVQMMLPKYASFQPIKEPSTSYSTIVLDTETTGLDPYHDEILELSILSDDGDVLYHGYFHPVWTDSWPDAEAVNHITMDMVWDAPNIYDELPIINGILKHATQVVAYNSFFDMDFLEASGAVFPEDVYVYDVMLSFAEIYGEFHPYYKDYKWQTLKTCAAYYGYQWGDDEAHDSLADAKATLYCYHCMTQSHSNNN